MPADNYRISPSRFYAVNVNFAGSLGLPAVIYVLEGCCKYKLNGEEMILQSQELVEIGSGDYAFQVIGVEGVKAVNVYELPPALRKPA